MSKIHWFGKKEGKSIELKVASEGVLVLLISNQNSYACNFSKEQVVTFSKTAHELNDSVKTLALSGSAFQFRLIGCSKYFAPFVAFFKEIGIAEGKHFSFEANTVSAGQSQKFLFLPLEGRVRKEIAEVEKSVEVSTQKTRVLVVDDSVTIQKLLKSVIDNDPEMECVATVSLPSEVDAAIQKYRPHVITLDIHMPEMDGVTLLKKILPKFKIPTIMISALSREDGTYVLDALEAGAVDYIQKPSMAELPLMAPIIQEKLKTARHSKIVSTMMREMQDDPSTHGQIFGEIDFHYLIAIGSSTGGTEALKKVLTRMPKDIPPVVIVQHIPPVFSKAFADRMNDLCPFEVKEAQEGDIVKPSRVLIAPGGFQMKLVQSDGHLKVAIVDAPPMNNFRPSVDYLFNSIADLKIKKVSAAILTGMGSDGSAGLLKLKNLGANTFAQDEETSVVFGMPRVALKIGATDKAVPIQKMAGTLINACAIKRRKSA